MHNFRKSTRVVMTEIWETFTTSSRFHSKDRTHLSAVGWVPLRAATQVIHPANPERHTHVISQSCCTMENGHRTLLLIIVKFLMDLEENESGMNSPAGKVSDT